MAAGSMIEIIVNPLARECSCIQLNDLRASSELNKSDKLFSDIAGGFTYLGKSKITQNRHILWYVKLTFSLQIIYRDTLCISNIIYHIQKDQSLTLYTIYCLFFIYG